jgi:ubiquinone/menaquinone biosynthesis C-methylase UbiE
MSRIWEDQLNAQLYEEYAQQFPMYLQLGQTLVALAEPLRPGTTVLDLACGTGIVTEQLVARLMAKSTVVGIDFSTAMLAIAKRKLPDATFYEARAEHIAQILSSASVDIAVCNSAFWQMQARPVLEGLNQVLKPGGRFLFNLPMQSDSDERTSPNLEKIMQRIAQEEYDYVPHQRPLHNANSGGRRQWAPMYGTLEDVIAFLEDMPLSVRSYQTTVEIEHTAQDSYAFLRIPIMSDFLLAGLDYPTRMEILERAYQRFDKTHRVLAQWRYYVMEKTEETR